ncbi:MAG: ABC transporter ATP-binding protein, partial [Acidimicrobiales bacterium]
TLLRAIAQLEESTGSVYVGRKDMRTVSHRYRGRLVAYLPQVPELPADMPVIEYVLLGRTPHLGYFAMATVKDHRLCADLLERLGVQPAEDRRLGTLSGGELQRVVLARALAQETPVLLLDEPTSALDLGRRIDALALVDEARRERGLTVVSAMHDLTLAGQFSDRLVLISEGRIVLSGTPAEVLTEDALSRYFGGPVRVLRTDDGELVVAPRAHQRISRVGSGHQDLSSC